MYGKEQTDRCSYWRYTGANGTSVARKQGSSTKVPPNETFYKEVQTRKMVNPSVVILGGSWV